MENNSNKTLVKILVLLLILGGLSLFARYYIDWLWFKSLDFQKVFAITLVSRWALYAIVFIIAFLFVFINLRLSKRNARPGPDDTADMDDEEDVIYLHPERTRFKGLLNHPMANWIFIVISLFVAFVVASTVGEKWVIVQQYLNRVPFAVSDPVFGKNVGFYFFDLSFYQFIYETLMFLLVFTTVIIGLLYLMNATAELFIMEWRKFTFAKAHFSVLLAMIFALKAWGYKLGMYSILFSPTGIVNGAGYTDVHARLLAYKVLLVVVLVVAAMIIVNLFVRRINWILYSIGGWIVLAIVFNGIYPALMQKFIVQPNEFNREKPYIERAINYSRMAYNLDEIENKQFNVDYNLTMQDLENNRPTIDNIRLWDWQPLQDTYKSLQELRLYYVFHDVDIDRYMVDGEYRQVMLSAREMEDMDRNEALDENAKTWVNQRLMFTHGYGVTMSPVAEVGEEGFPEFYLKDVPPKGDTNLEVKRPEIYFGERTDSYVIVNTNQKEFDYPKGATNTYTTYEGKNGVEINSFSRRLLFAWVLKDYKLIFSSDVNNQSQVLMKRNITDRINTIAPYLRYDQDPYLVINKDGRLIWMVDAYTASDKFPYSKPFDRYGNNYIRNAVKVTCDAYTGEVNFYIADPSDPIIQSFQKIFPGLYKPYDEMPEDLKAHVRYPVDMFSIQANIYKVFHMTDPWVFYNKEDSWVIPSEIVGGKEEVMEPYYLITRLPGEQKEEYILMLPYIPNGRLNMTAWMCARMDGDNYGKMLVYRFPKQETVYGPMQIESRINQDTDISRQLALWNQKGSSTYRGNLLVIPINNSILYVEPLYLQAEASKLPELKRVIASYQNQVVMENTLEEALERIFGQRQGGTTTAAVKEEEKKDQEESSVAELAKLAQQYYDQADESLRKGDWAGYGDNLKQLKEVLDKLEKAAE